MKRFDPLSPVERSQRMGKVRSMKTRPELLVRSILKFTFYKFKSYDRRLPGNPDFVFPHLKKVIFVHGCFWHQHRNCNHYRMPKTRNDFWLPKLERNVKRDSEVRKLLRQLGWTYFIIWECQLKNLENVAANIVSFLEF